VAPVAPVERDQVAKVAAVLFQVFQLLRQKLSKQSQTLPELLTISPAAQRH
jgi:hypothetical protein